MSCPDPAHLIYIGMVRPVLQPFYSAQGRSVCITIQNQGVANMRYPSKKYLAPLYSFVFAKPESERVKSI
jgi:hypothetical protein